MGGLCYVGKGQRSLTWHQHSNMIATVRPLTQILIGFTLKSMKIRRIPGISATATSPSGDIPAKPAQFLRVPFSSLLHPAAIWNNLGSLSSPISLIHGPWPQNACHCIYHISLSVGPITLQSFPPFTVGEAPMRPSRRMESMHTTRDAQSCQS